MAIDNQLLLNIKSYIEINYVPRRTHLLTEGKCCRLGAIPNRCERSIYDDVDNLRKRVDDNLSNSWQEALFSFIDAKGLNDVDVYKNAEITKQTFSKIRSDSNYHPDKDTAIRLCIGLKLNLDDTLDLIGKAGYTLSASIKRDLVIKYFIENEEYDIGTIDCVLEELKLKQFLKY